MINARRSVVGEIFERARQRGEVTNPNTDFLIDLVYGPMWYRLLFGAETLDDAYADQLVDTVLAAAVRGASATPVEGGK